MKKFVVFVFALACAISAQGQKQLRVIDWKSEQTVNTFLLSKMHDQYDARRNRLKRALESTALTTAYRDSCKIRYKQILGQLPSRTSLNVQVTGKIQGN